MLIDKPRNVICKVGDPLTRSRGTAKIRDPQAVLYIEYLLEMFIMAKVKSDNAYCSALEANQSPLMAP
jgi:hypothetical protein